jgi:hypothetical protein
MEKEKISEFIQFRRFVGLNSMRMPCKLSHGKNQIRPLVDMLGKSVNRRDNHIAMSIDVHFVIPNKIGLRAGRPIRLLEKTPKRVISNPWTWIPRHGAGLFQRLS